MKTAAQSMSEAQPQGMQEHAYEVMYEIEDAHWWYRGRRRIIAGLMEEICREFVEERPRILDVGCGTGANLQLLEKFGEVEGIDVSEEALAFCRERGHRNVRHGEAEKLPFDDGSFDIVTALDVVEHLDDDLSSLKEMRRVLKTGGRIVLFVPAFMFLWGIQDELSNHRRRYTLPQLVRVVREAGFSVERASYANIIFFAPILLVRTLMRAAGIRPATGDFKVNVPALNAAFGRIFGAESALLRRMNLPFGVSALCIARRAD